MKQATAGSGSAADPSYPDTAAANAELEAKLTGGNTGGAGSAMPNEAQVRVAACKPPTACKLHASACLYSKVCLERSTFSICRGKLLHCVVLAAQSKSKQCCNIAGS